MAREEDGHKQDDEAQSFRIQDFPKELSAPRKYRGTSNTAPEA
jgi:hypothetical protein